MNRFGVKCYQPFHVCKDIYPIVRVVRNCVHNECVKSIDVLYLQGLGGELVEERNLSYQTFSRQMSLRFFISLLATYLGGGGESLKGHKSVNACEMSLQQNHSTFTFFKP